MAFQTKTFYYLLMMEKIYITNIDCNIGSNNYLQAKIIEHY